MHPTLIRRGTHEPPPPSILNVPLLDLRRMSSKGTRARRVCPMSRDSSRATPALTAPSLDTLPRS